MIEILKSSLLSRAGLVHGFTTREGGVSRAPFASLNLGYGVSDRPQDVDENLRRVVLAAGLAAPPARVHQVHGDRVVCAWELHPETAVEADGLIGRLGSPPVSVRTADCAAVLLADPGTGLVAALHAGWRGLARGILGVGVARLVGLGARVDEMIAAVGPCIGPCCYEVGSEVAVLFVGATRCSASDQDKLRLDLPAVARGQLRDAGLRGEHIELLGRCTACEPNRFFSHRASGGRTGRNLAFIAASRRGREETP